MGTRQSNPTSQAPDAARMHVSSSTAGTAAEGDRPRILISRMSAIGDTILTLPVACALREQYPNAYLGWVVESKAATMVRDHDALDTVIELPRKWFLSRRGVKQARETLREHKFDITLDCQGNTKSSLACYLSGAKRRIGYKGAHALELSPLFNNDRVAPALTHLTDRSLELLSPLGIHCPAVQWRLPIGQTERQWAGQYRTKFTEDRIVILNPGGTWPSKLWEADRFAATARYLSDRYGYRAWVVWGTFEERLMAEQIVEESAGTATLAPDTSLMSLAALIETADLFISGDTGPLHMSVAVDTATIGLYGATRPGDSGPYGQTALQNAYESGGRRHRRSADNRAMRAIGVEHVCQAVDDLHRHFVDVPELKAA